MRWMARQWHAVAQDGGLRAEESPLTARALRKKLIRQSHALHLQSPFSWRDYVSALFRIPVPSLAPYALYSGGLKQPLAVTSMVFGPGESARWIMQRGPGSAQSTSRGAPPQSLLVDGVRYTLLLPELPDDEYLEHIVYHELGHMEHGHLTRALAMGDDELRCASEDDPSAANDAMNATQRWEQEAELFALTLTRLARGWDPALTPANVAHFFDFLM